MPRIVFWSPYENMTGNTHTAVAISTLMGMTHKDKFTYASQL